MKRISQLAQNNYVQHTLFWAFSYYVLLNVFAYESPFQAVDYIYTFLFHISLVLGVYFNLSTGIPIFLKSGRYIAYMVFAIFCIGLIMFSNEFTFNYLSDYFFPGYFFISYYNYWDLFQFGAIYIATSTLLKLSKAWFQVNKQERQIKLLEEQKLKAELKALQQQIQPHFLFNSLNALYNMVEEKDPRASTSIIRLADNLRYLLYEVGEHWVSIEKEIEFINNYIELQKLRFDGDQVNIQFDHNYEDQNGTKINGAILPF
ncbi:MAG: histidine kinase [Bacteroidota bacterium]